MEEKYRKFFLMADTDKSGYLTLNELIYTLTKHGYKGGEEKIKRMFRAVDSSGDEKINLEEYLVAMGQLPERDHKEAAMRSVFRKFDTDGSGTIDRAELQAVFKDLGRVLSDRELESIMKNLDKDQSGTLNYEEFIKTAFAK